MTDFIGRYYLQNTLACREAIEWFTRHIDRACPGKVRETTGSKSILKDIKESLDITASIQTFYEQGYFFKEILDFLWDSVQEYIRNYEELEGCSFTISTDINLQYYKPPSGGFKAFHFERSNVPSSRRCLVWMIYLNTVSDGGGTEFKYYNHTEKAEEGKLLIWPTDFTHTHKGVISETEEKYVLTGWYEFI